MKNTDELKIYSEPEIEIEHFLVEDIMNVSGNGDAFEGPGVLL